MDHGLTKIPFDMLQKRSKIVRVDLDVVNNSSLLAVDKDSEWVIENLGTGRVIGPV